MNGATGSTFSPVGAAEEGGREGGRKGGREGGREGMHLECGASKTLLFLFPLPRQ
jgi:hypothetical protein